MLGLSCVDRIAVLTRNSPPTLPPLAEKSCALMLVPEASPPSALLSVQVATKPPEARLAIAGESWLLRIVVLTRNSPPSFTPLAL